MKRFTETSKWLDAWFSELSPMHKLAWLYLLDNCDAAGVIDPPGRVATSIVGEGVDWRGFLGASGGRVAVLPNGKWFIVKFIAYQYKGNVHPTSAQHSKVRESIAKNHLRSFSEPSANLPRRLQEEEEDKEEDKDTEEEEDTEAQPGHRLEQIAAALCAGTQWKPNRLSYDTKRDVYDNWRCYADITDADLDAYLRFRREAHDERHCQSLRALLLQLPAQIDRAHAWAQDAAPAAVNGASHDEPAF